MQRRLVVVVLVMALGLAGCPKNSYHDAVVAEHDAKTVVAAFQQAEIVEFHAGRIDIAEHQRLEDGIGKVGLAGVALTSALQQGASTTTALADFNLLAQAVGDLNSQGVLGIKNPQSQAALAAGIKSIQAVLANVQILLAQPTTETLTGATKP
jgi:outer membrane lipoprotein SlyB